MTTILDVITLADGTRIDTSTGAVLRDDTDAEGSFMAVPTNTEATQLVLNARRKLSDLPDVPARMNGIAAVVAYTLFGLDDTEIALALGITEDQTKRLKTSLAYEELYNQALKNIRDGFDEDVRTLFAAHAQFAARQQIALLRDEAPGIRLAAAKEVLDRAGHRPADVVLHKHSIENELRIRYIDEEREAPLIELETE